MHIPLVTLIVRIPHGLWGFYNMLVSQQLIMDVVMVQPDKVEVCELKPKMLTKDKGDLVWRQTSNCVMVQLD